MTGNSRNPADPIEHVIEAALAPGDFIEDYACFSFISDLAEVEEQIAKTEHGRVVALYESFIAGCYEKGSEVDAPVAVLACSSVP